MTRSHVFFVIVTSFAAGEPAAFANAQDPPTFAYPETRAGRIADAFFTALADGSDEALRAFVTSHWSEASLRRRSVDDRTKALRQIRDVLTGLSPHVTEETREHRLALFARCPVGWFRVVFELEEQPPHRLDGLELRPGSPPSATAVDYDGWRTVGELLEDVRAATGAPGVAAAHWSPAEPRRVAAVGVRELGADAGIEPACRFPVGSVSKSMTATLVGILVQRGELRFETTIGQALDGVTMRGDYAGVTVEQLLRHRGGLRAHLATDAELEARLAAIRDPRQQRRSYAEVVLGEEPVGTPGSTFSYSNAGYALVAHIAESRAGEPFEALIRERLWAPLGMRSAGFGVPSDHDPGQPRGHVGTGVELRVRAPGEEPLLPFLAPAGGMHASMEDLLRFGELHLRGLRGEEGLLLEPATVRRLHAPPPGDGRPRYAAGWILEGGTHDAVHWHGGSDGAYLAVLHLDLGRGVVVAVAMTAGALSNVEVATRVASSIAGRAGGG